MIYTVRREGHPYWPFIAAGLAAPRSIALRVLADKADGAETQTSHVGLDQVREDLLIHYGEDTNDWPVAITPCLADAA
jgi:hypothetical protein